MRHTYLSFLVGHGRILSRLVLTAAALLSAASAEAQSFSTVLATNLFQPTAIAVSPLNRYYISDSGNNRIVEFNPNNFAFSALAGSALGAADGRTFDASFRSPQGLVSLPDGLIVADAGNNLIRRISYQGQVEIGRAIV